MLAHIVSNLCLPVTIVFGLFVLYSLLVHGLHAGETSGGLSVEMTVVVAVVVVLLVLITVSVVVIVICIRERRGLLSGDT